MQRLEAVYRCRTSTARGMLVAFAAFVLTAPGYGDEGETTPDPIVATTTPTSAAEPSSARARSEKPTYQEVGDGRWRKFETHRFDAGLTDEQRESIEQLEALGYLSGTVRAGVEEGVTIHVEERAFGGLNFFTSGHAPEAILMEMNGDVVHRWRQEFDEIWPDHPVENRHSKNSFRRAHLFENGDILAIFEGVGIIKLDSLSNLLWANPIGAHHDLDVLPNGDIYVLTREAHVVPRVREDQQPILEDFISILDAKGELVRKISLLECFENSDFQGLLLEPKMFLADPWLTKKWKRGDIFHSNSLEVLDGRIAGRVPEFAKGNVLVSLRVPSVIAVVDLALESVVWAMKGSFLRQHDPKVLSNGNLLVFDNLGLKNHSSVIELDPVSRETRWEFVGSPEQPFFTDACGTAARLPNGNTLITESDNGRAFEISREREIVWEFYNPHRAGDQRQYIATLYDVVRLPPDFPTSWLRSGGAPGPAK